VNPAASARPAGWLDPGTEVIDRISQGIDQEGNIALLEDLCSTMLMAHCAVWGHDTLPVRSALQHLVRISGAGRKDVHTNMYSLNYTDRGTRQRPQPSRSV